MNAQRKRWPKGTYMKITSGAILRAVMDSKHLSNGDVGLSAQCSRTFISALVNGRRTSCTPELAERIAKRLEVPIEVLFVPKRSADSGQNDKTQRKVAA